MQRCAGRRVAFLEQPPKGAGLTIEQPPLYLEQSVRALEESEVELAVMEFSAVYVSCHTGACVRPGACLVYRVWQHRIEVQASRRCARRCAAKGAASMVPSSIIRRPERGGC